jgi:hypothetical protein
VVRGEAFADRTSARDLFIHVDYDVIIDITQQASRGQTVALRDAPLP